MEMQLNVARYYSHENKHIYSEPTVRNIILIYGHNFPLHFLLHRLKTATIIFWFLKGGMCKNDCFALIFASFFLAFEGLNISLYISVFDKSKRSRLERWNMILDEHCSRKGLLLGSVFLNILDEICEYGRLR